MQIEISRSPISIPKLFANNIADLDDSRLELVYHLNPSLRKALKKHDILPDDLPSYDNCVSVDIANVNHDPERDKLDTEYGIQLFDYSGMLMCRIPDFWDRVQNRLITGINFDYKKYKDTNWNAREVLLKWWLYHDPEEGVIHRSDFELQFVRNLPRQSAAAQNALVTAKSKLLLAR